MYGQSRDRNAGPVDAMAGVPRVGTTHFYVQRRALAVNNGRAGVEEC